MTVRACECGAKHYGKGLCQKHYMQARRGGLKKHLTVYCHCGEVAKALGLCTRHYHAEWAALNPEKTAAKQRKYQQAHPGRRAAVYADWASRNLDRKRASNNARRARLKGSAGKFSREEWSAVLEMYGGRCRRCATDEKLTVDHIIPLSAGGGNGIDNIQPLCLSCNSSKGSRYVQADVGL